MHPLAIGVALWFALEGPQSSPNGRMPQHRLGVPRSLKPERLSFRTVLFFSLEHVVNGDQHFPRRSYRFSFGTFFPFSFGGSIS